MKQKRSMDDAIEAAKRMRQQLSAETAGENAQPETRLKVVDSAHRNEEPTTSQNRAVTTPNANRYATFPSPISPSSSRQTWVRHTIGLRETTSLRLRDAAEAQKRKARYGTLANGEPSNEQEIADFGIQLALRELGVVE